MKNVLESAGVPVSVSSTTAAQGHQPTPDAKALGETLRDVNSLVRGATHHIRAVSRAASHSLSFDIHALKDVNRLLNLIGELASELGDLVDQEVSGMDCGSLDELRSDPIVIKEGELWSQWHRLNNAPSLGGGAQ